MRKAVLISAFGGSISNLAAVTEGFWGMICPNSAQETGKRQRRSDKAARRPGDKAIGRENHEARRMRVFYTAMPNTGENTCQKSFLSSFVPSFRQVDRAGTSADCG